MYEGSLKNQYNYKQYFVLILVIHIFGNDVILLEYANFNLSIKSN